MTEAAGRMKSDRGPPLARGPDFGPDLCECKRCYSLYNYHTSVNRSVNSKKKDCREKTDSYFTQTDCMNKLIK